MEFCQIYFYFKGIVHSKIKINQLLTNICDVDGEVIDFSEFTKAFGVS